MIGIEQEAQKLSLGLKPSYFEGEEGEVEDVDVADADLEEDALEAAAELESDDEDIEPGQAPWDWLNHEIHTISPSSSMALFA